MRLRAAALVVALLLVAAGGVLVGSVALSFDQVLAALQGSAEVSRVTSTIVWQVRLPRTITAIFAGAALGVAGVQLQTLFRNPLAEPYILGISSGASLGVALAVLVIGQTGGAALTAGLGWTGDLLVSIAAAAGAALVTVVIVLAARWVSTAVTLLLLGVMVGYLVSATVSVLLAGAAPELIASYTRWGFGSYQGVTWDNLRVLVPVLLLGLVAALPQARALNALLLGERYAATMGLQVARTRLLVVVTSAWLAGAVTAFCGPIAFLGIAVPHLARALMRTSNHYVVLPAAALMGATLALLADILAGFPGDGVLPLNAVNAMFGAPVVIWLLFSRRQEAR